MWVGRKLLNLWHGGVKIHEIYTCAWGLYACWLTIRLVTVVVSWIPQGRSAFVTKLKVWGLMVKSMSIIIVCLINVPDIYLFNRLARCWLQCWLFWE